MAAFIFPLHNPFLSGKITDEETGETLIAANVIVQQNGVFITGVSTDFDGNYKINLDPGTYEIIVSFLGYPNHLVKNIEILKDHTIKKIDLLLKQCAPDKSDRL